MIKERNLKEVKTIKLKKSILLRISILAFIIYFIVVMVNQQININKKKQELDTLNEQIKTQELVNDEMRHILDSSDSANQQYIEKKARENLNLVDPGERVFVNIAGG